MATILIVDDDHDTRELLKNYLSVEGYESVAAANGWEALLALDEQPIDLILLDVMMPGMNGITFLNILRNAQQKMNTPVVVVTALSPDDVRSETRGLRVQDILPKTQALFTNLIETVKKNLPKEQAARKSRGHGATHN